MLDIYVNRTGTRVLSLLLIFAMTFSMVLSGGIQVAFANQDPPPPTTEGGNSGTATDSNTGTTISDPTTNTDTGNSTGSVNDLWNQVGLDGVGQDLSKQDTNLGTLVSKGQEVARAITSIMAIISFLALLFWVAKLATSAGNPQSRKIALTGILFSGVALAIFGGAWVVVSFFWNLLSGV